MITFGDSPAVRVDTLVQGACRRAFTYVISVTVVVREVWCNTGWLAANIPEEGVPVWEWELFCMGHVNTCTNTSIVKST